MWDGELTARVRDRKLNEILTYAAMVKIDPVNKDRYIDIIDALSLDIDACDSLIDTNGEVEVVLEPIVDQIYYDRLTSKEAEDERTFNSYKIDPVDDDQVEPDEDIEDYVKELIREAVDSIKSESSASTEGLDALKTELRMCRERIDQLTNELEYARSESSQFEDENKDIKAEAEKMMEEIASLKNQLEESMSAKAAQSIDSPEESVADVVQQVVDDSSDRKEPSEDNGGALSDESEQGIANEAEDKPAPDTPMGDAPEEGPAPTESEPVVEDPLQEKPELASDKEPTKPIVDRILTDVELETLSKIKKMKIRKIDEFIDRSLTDKANVNYCDDIVTFLKVDVGICDALLEMDYTDIDSIVNGFKEILDILEEAPDPRSQSIYVRSLTDEERILEAGYNGIVEHVQAVMLDRYANLL